MTTTGFDKEYYLTEKLEQLQLVSSDWQGATISTLESVLNSAGLTAEQHYEMYGWQEGLSPNAYFNGDEYITNKAESLVLSGVYEDVSTAVTAFKAGWTADPYQHYLQFGAWENGGVDPSDDFDTASYYEAKLAQLQTIDSSRYGSWTVDDVEHTFQSAGLAPLVHWYLYGKSEGVSPLAEGTGAELKLVVGTTDDDTLTGTSAGERIIGNDGDDTITGGAGDDIIRGGGGVDSISAGNGDDSIVVVGDLTGGGKIDSAEDTRILGTRLSTLNGVYFGEDEHGSAETIYGGNGTDTLYVYGTADISNYRLDSIEDVVIRSDVTFDTDELSDISSLRGSGASVVRAVSDDSVTLDLSSVDLSELGMIEVGKGVTLKVDSLSDLGGATTLTGDGKIIVADTDGTDLSSFVKTDSLTIRTEEGSTVTGITEIDGAIIHGSGSGSTSAAAVSLIGTNGDDIIYGTDLNELINGRDGDDILSGRAGDDTYIIDGSGTKTIVDSNGSDTLDLSSAVGAASLDLSSGGSVGSSDVIFASGATTSSWQPVDLYLLEDLSSSFSDDVETVQQLISGDGGLVAQTRALQPDTDFGVGSFVDKPTGGFGGAEDYVYETELTITRDLSLLQSTVDTLEVKYGDDSPEAQLEALYQTALRADDEIGFREGSLRVVVLTTDASYHEAGDFAEAGVNDGDIVLDGTPAGTGEDYPSVAQVSQALVSANIYPVFAVTEGVNRYYTELVEQLGRGSVVELESDSSNIIEVIQEALTTVSQDSIENVIGTAFNDTITVNSLDNTIDGGAGYDTVVLSGSRSDYTITANADTTSFATVNDSATGHDGNNTLQSVERLVFSDGDVVLTGLTASDDFTAA